MEGENKDAQQEDAQSKTVDEVPKNEEPSKSTTSPDERLKGKEKETKQKHEEEEDVPQTNDGDDDEILIEGEDIVLDEEEEGSGEEDKEAGAVGEKEGNESEAEKEGENEGIELEDDSVQGFFDHSGIFIIESNSSTTGANREIHRRIQIRCTRWQSMAIWWSLGVEMIGHFCGISRTGSEKRN